MSGITRYAKALLGLAQEQQLAETIGAELARTAEVLADPALAKTLSLPNLSPRTRKEVVDQLVKALAPANHFWETFFGWWRKMIASKISL